MRCNYNYDMLRGAIKANFRKQSDFAAALGISERSLSLKLNNKVLFTQYEIDEAIKLLKLNPNKLKTYFFTEEV